MTLSWHENNPQSLAINFLCERWLGAYIRRALKEEKLHALWKKAETA